ncbi:MAG: phospholipase D family protein, partial [Caldilinea sp.]|nr:phospholipase D family protein [Caldilinea sp.]
NGKYYRPNHAILSEIHRARHSIRLCLFLLGELQGEHGDSVIDALIQARARGVDVQAILNGHLARQGDPGREYTMEEELRRPLLPAVYRLQQAGIPLLLAYGRYDQPVPYCPIHSKYCVIDERIVLEGSFNWYNTS